MVGILLNKLNRKINTICAIHIISAYFVFIWKRKCLEFTFKIEYFLLNSYLVLSRPKEIKILNYLKKFYFLIINYAFLSFQSNTAYSANL